MYGKVSLSDNVVTVDNQSTKARTHLLQSCLVGYFSFKDIDCAELKRWASVAWEIRAEFHIFPLSAGRVIFQLPSALEAERILRQHEKSWKGTPFILDRWDTLSDYGDSGRWWQYEQSPFQSFSRWLEVVLRKVMGRPKTFKANSAGINPTNEELHGYRKHQSDFNHIRKGQRIKHVWIPKVKSDGCAQRGPDKVIPDCYVALAPCFLRPKPNILEINFNNQKQQFLVGLGCIKLCVSLPDLFGFRQPWFMGKAKDALQTLSFGKAVPVFQPFPSSFHSSAPMLCDANSVTEVNYSSFHDSIIPCVGNIQNCFDSSCLVVELQLSDNDDHADFYSYPSHASTLISSENDWFAEDDLWISTHSILDGNKLGLSFMDNIQEEQQIFQRVEEERILAREESRRLKIAKELKRLECSVIHESGETSTVRKRHGDLSSNN
ncbi:hypothetical protein RJ639_015230 [Escallonia herrerae]|uniref:DUF4283 domain-containing protein n=1 Tax=Escallonia herrerae TaxID=1293975 RepID=A0AA89AKZ2_9ASTE|nr:hypothetical protein RJ639_015230 [Escallonia herrerae]